MNCRGYHIDTILACGHPAHSPMTRCRSMVSIEWTTFPDCHVSLNRRATERIKPSFRSGPPQQQEPSVAGDLAAVEISFDCPPFCTCEHDSIP